MPFKLDNSSLFQRRERLLVLVSENMAGQKNQLSQGIDSQILSVNRLKRKKKELKKIIGTLMLNEEREKK